MIAIIWTVQASGPISFLLSFGVLLSLGLAFISPVSLTPMLSRWFIRRRGTALFFLSPGYMAGIALLTPVLGLSNERVVWKVSLVGFDALLGVVPIPLVFILLPEKTHLAA